MRPSGRRNEKPRNCAAFLCVTAGADRQSRKSSRPATRISTQLTVEPCQRLHASPPAQFTFIRCSLLYSVFGLMPSSVAAR